MSNQTIPNLPAAISLTGSEQLQAVQNGTSVRVTAQQIANLNANGGTVTSITASYPLSGGTITTSGSIGLTPASVDNTYLALMPANTIKGNNTATTGVPVDLTVNQTMTLLGAAPLASPTFTGVPKAPTPSTADNSTQIATTAYVKAQGFGSGTVTSIATGTGLTGGPITTTGTISIATTGVTAGTYGSASIVPVIAVNSQGQITSATNTSISISPSQVTGLGTMATQNANSVAITGGTINSTTIGGTTPAAATFTALTATGLSNFGTIASGVWNGSTIGIGYGGTGATTSAGARTNLGAAASGANSDITSLSGLTTPLSAPQGGTGFGSYTTGDILYADTSSTLARLNDVASGNALISGGVGVAPAWGKIGLTTHVSGTLPVTNGGTGATTLTGFLKGNGTSAFTAQTTITNSDLTNSSITIGSTSISLGGSTTTISGLTTLTLTQDPTSALQASTKQYVDGQVASVSNTTFHTAVYVATTADLGTVTYSNGTGGVGATITNSGAQTALTIDGYTFTATDVTNATRVLVKDQSSGLQNGIYVVTNQGSILTNWQLTRSSDFNTVGTGPNFIETGAGVFVSSGTTWGSTSWVMNTTGTINVGSTALVWVQTSSAGNFTVSSPITKTGNIIGLSTVGVANGGTGLTSLTQYGLLYAPTTSSVGQVGTGTSGYPLLSSGAGSAPSFSQLSLSGVGITGTLGVANGGTGTSTAFTSGSIVFAGASGVYSQNNSKFFWDNTNNRIGINTASPNTNLTIVSNTQTATPVSSGSLPAGTDIYIMGANAANTRITQDAYGTGNYAAYTGRQARGTAASPTASQTDDILVEFTGRGYGATAFSTASVVRIDLEAAENFTDTAQGTYISMHTSALGTTTPVERFRVGPSGQWGIGGATYGTSGYAFVSGGASAAPSWSQISLTAGVTGILPATNGGTGQSSYTTGDILYASSSSALSKLAGVAIGNVLLSQGVGVAPAYGQVNLATTVTGTLPVTNGGTGQASALTQYGVVYGSTTSAMATTAAGTTGQVLIATTGGAPSWSSSIPSTAGVTSFSAGTTGLTPSSATTGAVVLAGTLAVGNGGTGLTSYTTGDLLYASGATTIAKLSDVATGSVLVSGGVGAAPAYSATPTVTSITAPTHLGGTTASSTLTLQSTSGVGTTDSVVIKVGNNGATTALTAASSGTVTIGTLNLTNALGTLYGGTGLTSFTSGGAVYATSTSALTTGTLPIASGGTGQTTASAAFNALSPITSTGDLIIGTGVNTASRLAIGTNGYVLTSNGTTAAWTALPSNVSSISFGTTGLTPSTATTGAVTVAGTLGTANGGTGLTGFTAANNAIYSTSSSALTAGTLPIAAGGTGITSFGTGVQTALGQAVTGSGGIVLATSPTIATPTVTTSATIPLVIGGTTASSTLTLQSTSGVGTTDSIVFKVGNNGAVTAATIGTTGTININTTGVAAKLYVNGNAAANIYALTDGATITPDFSQGNNFSVTLGGNRTLANPTNLTVGQSGVIYVSQDATGSRTLSYGTNWKFPSGTAPTLTTTANAVDALFYVVRTSTSITVNSVLNIG